PAPGPAQTALWTKAKNQALLPEWIGRRLPRSDALRMLLAVQRDEQLAPGVGWYDPARRRHDWAWLAARFDRNGDGRIVRAEFTGPPEFFAQLDRDRDGAITESDLDWSQRSPWVRQEAQALRLFREIDRDGNGRITAAEWQEYFDKKSSAQKVLTPESLRDLIAGERDKGKAKRVSRDVWLRCLIAGDLGSAFDGPRVDELAPDFTLPLEVGHGTITLSDFRGKKPVVLVFGSFT